MPLWVYAIPAIGRFLSADIFVQSPFSTQSYNRYSYVINNPLSLNDPSGYCYNGPDTVSQMMMDRMLGMLESHHSGMVMDTMGSMNAYIANKAINKLVQERGLRFNEDKTKIIDRHGRTVVERRLNSASGGSGNSNAASGSSTQVAGASVSGASSNGALADVLGGDANAVPAVSEDWSDINPRVDSYSVTHIGGSSGMDSQMNLMCGIFCQIRGEFIEWGMRSGASPRQVHRALEIGTYVGMIGGPLSSIGRGILKNGVRANAYSVAVQVQIAKVGKGTRPAHFRDANTQLQKMMNDDPSFAAMMNALGISIPQNLGKSPKNWTWHHVPDKPGVLELVPFKQHKPGSPEQLLLHPERKGGFVKWGADY